MVKLTVMEHKPSQILPPIKATNSKRARKICYMKRKDSIMKKAMELSVLCGVKACVVCYGPNGEVETWPEKRSDVRAVIEMYRQYGNSGRGKRVGQFCEKIENAEPEIEGAKKDRLRDVLLGWDDGWLSGLSAGSLRSLAGVLQTKLKALTEKIEFLKRLNEMSYLLECDEVAEPCGMTTNVEMTNPFMVLQPRQHEHMIDLHSSEKYSTFDASGQISANPIQTWNGYGGNPIKISGGNISNPNRISATTIWPPLNYCYGNFTSCFINANNRECLDSLSSETPIEPWNWNGNLGGNVSAIDMFEETNLDSVRKPVSHFAPPPTTSICPENSFGDPMSNNECELELIDPQLLLNSGDLVSSNDSELQWNDSQFLANTVDLMSSDESELPWIDPQLPA